jgi:hypothetical protein
MKEDLGRFWGWGVMRWWRQRMRPMVLTEGTVSTWPVRW